MSSLVLQLVVLIHVIKLNIKIKIVKLVKFHVETFFATVLLIHDNSSMVLDNFRACSSVAISHTKPTASIAITTKSCKYAREIRQ
jgi:hypothetical protein